MAQRADDLAQRRGLTQPAVSGHLARLERELGEPLFVRSSRGVTPTSRADELARRVGAHVDELRSALSEVDDRAAYAGTVHLAGAVELMAARVLPALAPLTTRGLRLRITLGLADDLLAALANARLDLVVSSVRPTDRALVATPFVDEEFVLVGAPTLVRTIDRSLLAVDPVRALAHLPLVAYAEELPIVRRYWRSEFGRRPPNPVAVVVPDLRAVPAAVVAGVGVSALPRYLADPALAAGSVELAHQAAVEHVVPGHEGRWAGEPVRGAGARPPDGPLA
ncbi:DNA-binding transcriptional LysR family regulator [Saccharothrix ecbatanensis]|uniref:DNA-binding transcriptional LysR family regulator n=1 Tax=Saccharothrix ecbatanensis TaxID=1105145 RepID=A0A7W9HM94_9PSEU|nr:LysR family transcriptional regulator [Saccharothrix ecbatanensis]MBB5804877.1 DNA-binding transcriptional LysR family regulator [Saccharothrix ecbatanensis]